MSRYETLIKQVKDHYRKLLAQGLDPIKAEETAARQYGLLYPEAGIPNPQVIEEQFGLTQDMVDGLISTERKPYGRAPRYPKPKRDISLFSQRRTKSGGEQ